MNRYTMQINDNLTLEELKGSLAFTTDAYLLYAYLRRTPKEKAAELGTGSGVISLFCASAGKAEHITAYELQDELCAVAAKNVEKNGLDPKITVKQADIRSLPREAEGSCKVVFANPPYQSVGIGRPNEEPANRFSRFECNGTIYDFAKAASFLLQFGGLFTAVFRPDRTCDLLDAMRQAKIEPKRLTFVYPTASHVPCLVLAEGKKGAAPGLYVTRPLLIYSSEGDRTPNGYTDEMKYIYEHGAFYDDYYQP